MFCLIRAKKITKKYTSTLVRSLEFVLYVNCCLYDEIEFDFHF